MELKECVTCGSHSFTDNKCDYCGNRYDETESYITDEAEEEITFSEPYFQETLEGKKLLKVMIIILISIIWFAVTVFVPPLFIITIILLVVYGTYCLRKINK